MQCQRMKREGHGQAMVRTYRILPSSYNQRSGSRSLTMLGSQPTVGPFTKDPSRPTNHKSTDQAQARVVVEGQPELNFTEPSATRLPANEIIDDDVEKTEIASENDSNNGYDRGFSFVEGDFDGSMSFCHVGSVMISQVEGEDGWCLVGENITA